MRGWRWGALGAAAMLWASVGAAESATLEEVLIPLERYTSEKARGLATTYATELQKIFTDVTDCLPWVSVFKEGLGFRTPRWAEGDDRHLSIWVWVEQRLTPAFAALSPAGRASAMLSRYGVDLLRRLSSYRSLLREPNLAGYAVVLSWLKPDQAATRPVVETLTVFADKATVQGFFARTMTPAQFLERAVVTAFDGTRRLGRLALEIWDDTFTSTFTLKGHPPPKHCRQSPGSP
ncbi:MAG: hypothetical protein ACE5JN_14305 [Candidatus Methylomirabilia bacterium]